MLFEMLAFLTHPGLVHTQVTAALLLLLLSGSVRCLSCGLETCDKCPRSANSCSTNDFWATSQVPARLRGPLHYLSLNVFKFA